MDLPARACALTYDADLQHPNHLWQVRERMAGKRKAATLRSRLLPAQNHHPLVELVVVWLGR
jgi:hypothetical protein